MANAQTMSVAIQNQSAANPLHFQTSLYVGDLAPETTEAHLFDVFNQAGTVTSIRICKDSSSTSLGYGYVNYHSHVDAERAMDALNFSTICGRTVRIMWCQRDPRMRKSGTGNVFVKGLTKSVDSKALYDLFSIYGNILSCKVQCTESGESKGFGFVNYDSQESADKAIEDMHGSAFKGSKIFVCPFKKKSERPAIVSPAKYTNIYVKNFPDSWTEEVIDSVFGEYGLITSKLIKTDNKGRKSAFINFEDSEHARAAVEALNGRKIVSETSGGSGGGVEGGSMAGNIAGAMNGSESGALDGGVGNSSSEHADEMGGVEKGNGGGIGGGSSQGSVAGTTTGGVDSTNAISNGKSNGGGAYPLGEGGVGEDKNNSNKSTHHIGVPLFQASDSAANGVFEEGRSPSAILEETPSGGKYAPGGGSSSTAANDVAAFSTQYTAGCPSSNGTSVTLEQKSSQLTNHVSPQDNATTHPSELTAGNSTHPTLNGSSERVVSSGAGNISTSNVVINNGIIMRDGGDSTALSSLEDNNGGGSSAVAPTDGVDNDPTRLYVVPHQDRSHRSAILKAKHEELNVDNVKSSGKSVSCNIYIKNLDESVDDEQLRMMFEIFGPVSSAKVMRNNQDQSLGYGFVTFVSHEDGVRAISEMHYNALNGKPLYVALHEPKERRKQRLKVEYGVAAGRHAGVPGPAGAGGIGGPHMPHHGIQFPPPQLPFPPHQGGNPANAATAAAMAGFPPRSLMAFNQNVFPWRTPAGAHPQTPTFGQLSGSPAMRVPPPQGVPAPLGMFTGMSPAMNAGPAPGGGTPLQGGANPPLAAALNRNAAAAGGPAQRPMPGGRIPTSGAGGAPIPQHMQQAPPPGGVGPPGSAVKQLSYHKAQVGGGTFKFTPQVRNQMDPHNPQQQQPIMSMQQQMQLEPMPSPAYADILTPAVLAGMNPSVQKQALGEKLYPRIAKYRSDWAGKITGMMLEMDNEELLMLLNNDHQLRIKVEEAVRVLDHHQQSANMKFQEGKA